MQNTTLFSRPKVPSAQLVLQVRLYWLLTMMTASAAHGKFRGAANLLCSPAPTAAGTWCEVGYRVPRHGTRRGTARRLLALGCQATDPRKKLKKIIGCCQQQRGRLVVGVRFSQEQSGLQQFSPQTSFLAPQMPIPAAYWATVKTVGMPHRPTWSTLILSLQVAAGRLQRSFWGEPLAGLAVGLPILSFWSK